MTAPPLGPTDTALLWLLLASSGLSTLLCAVLMCRRAAFLDDAYALPMFVALCVTVWHKILSVRGGGHAKMG